MEFGQTIASAAAGLFGKSVTVTQAKRLSPHLLQVRLEGPAIRKAKLSAGDKIKIYIGGGEKRSYTPSAWNHEESWMEVIIHLHGNGAASKWASKLVGGERTEFRGPSSSMPSITKQVPWAMFFGDETAIGLAQALYHTLPAGVPFTGFIELDSSDLNALDACSFPHQAVQRDDVHGPAMLKCLDGLQIPEGEGYIWLSGEASTVQMLRRALLERGIHRRQLLIKPYWSVKGKKHRKMLEKGELRS